MLILKSVVNICFPTCAVHQYPDHGLNRLTERLILFKHDYNSQNLLPINAASDVTDGALIEIIVSGIFKLFINISHTYVNDRHKHDSTV